MFHASCLHSPAPEDSDARGPRGAQSRAAVVHTGDTLSCHTEAGAVTALCYEGHKSSLPLPCHRF